MKTKPAEEAPKRTRRKEARPGEIIAAGIAEFAEHGFERARLDRIAKAAGVAKGTIYLYFENKEALFMAAVEEYVVSAMAETEADMAFDQNAKIAEVFRRLVARLYDKMAGEELLAIMRILISEGHRFPHLIKTYHDTVIERGMKILNEILARGRARGEITPGPVDQTPEVIIAPVMFYCVHKMVFDGLRPMDRDAFIEAHLTMILGALDLKSA